MTKLDEMLDSLHDSLPVIHEETVDPGLAANEYLEEDVNKFADLARATPPVDTLMRATRGDLRSSARFTRVLVPHGYRGDELRAVFLNGESAWGFVALHRREGTFDDREVAFVAEIGARPTDQAGCRWSS